MVSLASVSDSLKVWKFDEMNSLSLTSRFIPTSLISNPQKVLSNQCYMNSIAWNHTNQVIAASGIDSKIYLIQANNGQVLSSLSITTETDTSKLINSRSVSFSYNSRYLTSTLNSSLQLWDLKKRQLKKVMLGHNSTITSTCFHFSGEIISGDQNGIVKIWDTKSSFQELSELKLMSNSSQIQSPNSLSVTSISIPYQTSSTSSGSSCGGAIAIGYTSGDLCIWDSYTSQLVRKQSCHIGSLTSLAYSPKNHRLVATTGSDGKLALIDTGSKATSIEPSASVVINGGAFSINSVSFHEDAIHSVVGLENGQIMVYDWRIIRKPLVVIDGHSSLSVKSVAFQIPKSVANSVTSLQSPSNSVRTSVDTSDNTNTNNNINTNNNQSDNIIGSRNTIINHVVTNNTSNSNTKTIISPLKTLINYEFTTKSENTLSSTTTIDHNMNMNNTPTSQIDDYISKYNNTNTPSKTTPIVTATNNNISTVTNNNNNTVTNNNTITNNNIANTGIASIQQGLNTVEELKKSLTRENNDSIESNSFTSMKYNPLNYSNTLNDDSTTNTMTQQVYLQKLRPIDNTNSTLINTSEHNSIQKNNTNDLYITNTTRNTRDTTTYNNNNLLGNSIHAINISATPPIPHSYTSASSDNSSFNNYNNNNNNNVNSGNKVVIKSTESREDSSSSFNRNIPSHNNPPHTHTTTTLSSSFHLPIPPYSTSHTNDHNNSNNNHTNSTNNNITHPLTNTSIHNNAPTTATTSTHHNKVLPVTNNISMSMAANIVDEFPTVTNAIRTVNVNDLEEALQLLRYDIHREVQDIIKEQIRQFTISKDETTSLIKDMSIQLAEILKANKELREENEYLRRIY